MVFLFNDIHVFLFQSCNGLTFIPYEKVLSQFSFSDIFRESNIEEWQEVMHITTPPLNIDNGYLG